MQDEISRGLPTLYNHNLIGSYPEEELEKIKGIWAYSTRILGSSTPNDIVQLSSNVKPNFDRICAHYSMVGLNHSTQIIWNDDLKEARNFPNYRWSPFLFSCLHHAIMPNEAWYSIGSLCNEKNGFIELCQQKNWRIPNTVCFNCPSEITESMEFAFPCYLKLSCSASGVGVSFVRSKNDLITKIKTLPRGTKFQIQSPTTENRFFNVQYEATSGKARKLTCTEQILENFSHQGNSYPTNFDSECWKLCNDPARHIAQQGFEGPFAFDVGIKDSKPAIIECNPRYNGCTYYSRIADLLGLSCWSSRNATVNATSLSCLELDKHTWQKDKGRGVILVCWGPITMKKLGILCAGQSPEECNEVYLNFCHANS